MSALSPLPHWRPNHPGAAADHALVRKWRGMARSGQNGRDVLQAGLDACEVTQQLQDADTRVEIARPLTRLAERRYHAVDSDQNFDDLRRCARQLGDGLFDLRRFDEAARSYQEALSGWMNLPASELQPGRSDGWLAQERLGRLHHAAGRYDDALRRYDSARRDWLEHKALVAGGREPWPILPPPALGQAIERLTALGVWRGDSLMAAERPDEALDAYRDSLDFAALRRELFGEDADTLAARALAQRLIGDTCRQGGDDHGALLAYHHALALCREGDLRTPERLYGCWCVLRRLADPALASRAPTPTRARRVADRLFARLLAEFPDDPVLNNLQAA